MGVLGVMWCYRVNKWLFSPSLEWWVVMMVNNKVLYMMLDVIIDTWRVSQQNSNFKLNFLSEYLFNLNFFGDFHPTFKKNPKFMLFSKEKICIATLQCAISRTEMITSHYRLHAQQSEVWKSSQINSICITELLRLTYVNFSFLGSWCQGIEYHLMLSVKLSLVLVRWRK